MLTRKKRLINKRKKKKGGKAEKENGWSADFWDWWNSTILNTVWFKALSKVGEGIKWTVSTVMNFIWYILSDIFVNNLRSVWLYVIVGFLGVGSLGAIAEAGDFNTFDFLFAKGGIFHIHHFVSISESATHFITHTLGNYNVCTILWLLITTLFQILGWITMDIINMLFTFKHVFICSISWIIIGTILSSFMIIYQKEIFKSVKEPTKVKEPKVKEPKVKEPKAKEPKAKEPKVKGGQGLHPTVERMFEPDLLTKLNQIPKASMEVMIQENPVPFGYLILCGFMKETETGYEFSEDSLSMIQLALSNTMNTMDPSGPKEPKDDWTTVNDSIEAFKFVHTASIHAMVRDGLDTKNGQKGGGNVSKRVIPLDKIKTEDVVWLSQQDASGFKKAKDHGLLKDGRITELGRDVVQKTVDQSISGVEAAWSNPFPERTLYTLSK
jgi:hypothetical protein